MLQVEFQVSAKTARLIGRENIADVDGALIELIKNSYDADATCVYVDFFMPFPDIPDRTAIGVFSEYLSENELLFVQNCYEEEKGEWRKKRNLPDKDQDRLRKILFSHNRIIVADNGSGMNLNIVKDAWMYIGTSNKEHNSISEKGRIKTGAKGIGRFALDKLSIQSLMYTKDRDALEVLSWDMDWKQFEEAELIGDVKADLSFRSTRYREIVERVLKEDPVLTEHDWSTGTMIILAPIREAWSPRLFKKVNANLKSINPIGSADRFEVIVRNHFFPEYDYRTEEVSIDDEDYDYRIRAEYDGQECLNIRLLRNEVNLSKRQITVEKYGIVEKRSVEEFWARDKFRKKGYRKEDYGKEICFVRKVQDILPSDGLEKIQKVGPFTAEMYFLRNANNEHEIMKKVAVRKRKNLLSQFSGVKLYRDNFKVRPYGDEGAMYDWIGMSERAQKSSISVANQSGTWHVQPYQMIGLVKIGRESNPYLEDMANREGIALTDTYYIFVSLLQGCLWEFEYDRQYIYREYAKWIDSIEYEMADYRKKIQEEAVRRAENFSGGNRVPKETGTAGEDEEKGSGTKQGYRFSEEEMYDTVYEMMKESERELNSKQIQQILSSSGIMLNTFFHEFNAINTQFHVEASQIRSRVNYILRGREYEGLAAYNPYHRIDSLEKNDMVTAAFLDVVMDGLKKESLKVQENSLRKMVREILSKWRVLLEEKHIQIRPILEEEEEIEDNMPIALVDMYIILNNFILNSAWFLEQEHNRRREISFRLKEEADGLHLFMENNGPMLAEKYRDNPDKIFELGETSKEGKGTGLGLWVVKETVERNDGTISVMEKQEGFGLEIIWKKRRQ